MIVRRGPAAVALSLALSTVGFVTAPTAVAAGDPSAQDGQAALVTTAPVKNTAACSDGSRVRLQVSSQDDGVLVAQGIVWTDGTNKWRWQFKHNSDVSAHGTSKASRGKGRAFQVRRTMVNLVGPDHFVFRAENLATGEVCRVAVYY